MLDLLLINKEELSSDEFTGSGFNYSTMRQNVLRSKDKLIKRKNSRITVFGDLWRADSLLLKLCLLRYHENLA